MSDNRDNQAEVEETLTYEDGRAPALVPPDTDRLEPGTEVRRFEILERVGAGGMGVVYAARDKVLDRKIALKFLHADSHGSVTRERRLVREAKSMAKLGHPNVAAVYDVGSYYGHIFIAMEFVDGVTLRRWLREERRWPEIREVFAGAGAGLAAAHDAGIVHRDFKPENVLVDRGGVARVTDFGLASDPDADTPAADAGKNAPGPDLTRTGAIMGTPRYMAPEQHLGLPTDPRADQFAFAVALYEAVYGHAPFAGDDVAAIADNVIHGRIRAPRRAGEAPRKLRGALMRALYANADQRFSEMAPLLALLEAPRRRWPLALGAAAAALVTSLIVVGATSEGPAPVVSCAGGEERTAEVWSNARQAAVQGAFADVRDPAASGLYEGFRDRLTRRFADWARSHRANCEATRVRGVQSEAAMDLRMQCLDRRLTELNALVELYSTDGDSKMRASAVGALDKLPQLSVCDQPEQLGAITPVPADPAERVEIVSLRAVISTARVNWVAGRYQASKSALERARTRVEQTNYAPLLAEFYYELGQALWVLGDSTAARDAFEKTAELASEAGDGLSETTAWISLMNVVGSIQDRTVDAETYVNVARAAMKRNRVPEDVEGRFFNNLGVVRFGAGRFSEALAAFENAARLYERSLGPDSPRLSLVLGNIGGLHSYVGNHREALAMIERSLAISRRVQGADHLDLAYPLTTISDLQANEGQYSAALATLDEVMRLRQLHQGPTHPEIAYTLARQGRALLSLGRLEQSVVRFEQAVDMHSGGEGDRHSRAIEIRLALAEVLLLAERRADAVAHMNHADQLTASSEPAVSAIIELAIVRAALDLHDGRLRSARERCTRAHERLRTLGDDVEHEQLARTGVCLFRARSPRIVAELDAIEKHLGTRTVSRHNRAQLDFAHARAYARAGRTEEARLRAEAALAILQNAEGIDVDLQREIDDWMLKQR